MFVAATAEESEAECLYEESDVRFDHYGPVELEVVEVPEVSAVVKSCGPCNCAATYMSRHSLVQKAHAIIAKYYDIPHPIA